MTRSSDFDTHPDRYRHWRLDVDGDVATVTLTVDEDGGLVDGLRAEDELLRPRRRHRAVRRRAAAALRAPRGQGGRDDRRAGEDVLRRRQHPDARPVQPRLEGELLQVHQRDPQRHRGRHARPPARPGSPRSTAPRPAAATSSRWPATRSCSSTTAPRPSSLPEVPLLGRAARHRRPDPRRRQAARPQGPRRPVRHQVRGLPRRHRRRLGPGRRDRPRASAGTRRSPAGPASRRRRLRRVRRHRHHADPAGPHRGRRHESPTPTSPRRLDRDARRVDITVHGPTDDAARRRGRGARAGRRTGGRSRSPARSTTWCCGCAPTSRSSAPGCSAPRVTSTGSWRTTPSSATWPTTGSCTRPRSTSSAPSSGSTSPAAAWSP